MLTRFSHFTIKAKDVTTAAQWYCDKLGFSCEQIDSHFASLKHPVLGGLGIYPHNTATPIENGSGLFFKCTDIQKTVTELRAKGVSVDDPIGYGASQTQFSFFYDFDGNKFGIIE